MIGKHPLSLESHSPSLELNTQSSKGAWSTSTEQNFCSQHILEIDRCKYFSEILLRLFTNILWLDDLENNIRDQQWYRQPILSMKMIRVIKLNFGYFFLEHDLIKLSV